MAPLPSTTITKPETALPTHAEVEDLYRRHRSDGVRFARRRGADDPESLFNHVFVDVMAKADTIDGPVDDAIAAYLYRSINNRVIAEHRRRGEPLVTYDDRIHGTYDPNAMFDDALVQAEWVQELLDHLTESEREVVINRYFEQRNSVETAEVLDKSPEAVRQLHRSAMLRLRFVLTVTAVVVGAVLAVAALHAALAEPVSTAPAETGESNSLQFEDQDLPVGQAEDGGEPAEAQTDGPNGNGQNAVTTTDGGQNTETVGPGSETEGALQEAGPTGPGAAGVTEDGTPAIRGTEGLPSQEDLEGISSDADPFAQQISDELDQFGNVQPATPTVGL